MQGLSIRYQQIGDAKRFYEILTHPDFIYFSANPESIEDEKRFLRMNKNLRLANISHNYTILLKNEIVGAIGVKIDQHRIWIGEVGYFVDRAFWGKGIAPAALQLVEPICFNNLGIERLELITMKENTASIRVAIKAGYIKEGIQKHKLPFKGKFADVYLFAKIKPGNGENQLNRDKFVCPSLG